MSAVSNAIRVSVVVPALNEEKRIESFLEQCRAGAPHQIIVVDGGSDDRTAELAARQADIVLEQHGGLACQLNRGAAACDGDALFFPYVDTHLPDGWHDEIRGILSDPDIAGGAFRLALDSPRLRFRIIALFANLRTSLGIGPLGDQAIFVRREPFGRMGGYCPDTILEDLDLVKRLRRVGRIRILAPAVRSSIRRWEQNGTAATTLRNWRFLVSHYLGLRGATRRAAYRRYRIERKEM